jgi:hypothetical protein
MDLHHDFVSQIDRQVIENVGFILIKLMKTMSYNCPCEAVLLEIVLECTFQFVFKSK